jgi:hypothetical protein
VLGAWLLAWGWAAEAHEPSYADGAPGSPAITPTDAAAVVAALDSPSEFSLAFDSPPPGAALAYRQRTVDPVVVRRRWDRVPPEPQGWAVVRAGFFDGENTGGNDFVFGSKFLGNVAPNVRLGGSLDWHHRSESATYVVDQSGGAVSQVTLSEVSTDLIPVMGLIEFHMPTEGLRPYFGFGAGYEWLVVDVNDYQSGVFYEDDFGGFGWQAYGGLNVRLSRNLEIGGEAFWNDSTVEREIYDPYFGALLHEEIDADGVGFRGGLALGF